MITIIGCGNLIRKDDGAGPILIRKLWDLGVPSNVRLADGGTAGMDVIFQIGQAEELIIIDACTTGAEPGTVFEIPGEEVEAIPLENINMHDFRWDHAIAMGRWLLKNEFPKKVTVYLIEAQDLSYGTGLTPKVEESVNKLAKKIIRKVSGEEIEVSNY
ncbi:MAG: hydrogenase maturation protease [Lysinibacillus sp.]|nr:hydrogenase maturation protease [Lysinibacillus sp.]